MTTYWLTDRCQESQQAADDDSISVTSWTVVISYTTISIPTVLFYPVSQTSDTRKYANATIFAWHASYKSCWFSGVVLWTVNITVPVPRRRVQDAGALLQYLLLMLAASTSLHLVPEKLLSTAETSHWPSRILALLRTACDALCAITHLICVSVSSWQRHGTSWWRYVVVHWAAAVH